MQHAIYTHSSLSMAFSSAMDAHSRDSAGPWAASALSTDAQPAGQQVAASGTSLHTQLVRDVVHSEELGRHMYLDEAPPFLCHIHAKGGTTSTQERATIKLKLPAPVLTAMEARLRTLPPQEATRGGTTAGREAYVGDQVAVFLQS